MKENIEVLEEGSNKKKRRKISSVVALIFFLISLLSSGFLIYNIFKLDGVEDLIRYIAMGILLFIDLILLIKMRMIWKDKPRKKKKPSKRIGFITFLIIYSIVCFSVGYVISYLYGTINNMNKKYVTYSSSLVVLKDKEVEKVSDVKDFKIGILKDPSSPEGYIIPKEVIKDENLKDENQVVKYESYTEMISDLYTSDIDAIFLSTDYPAIYGNMAGYENIKDETKIIISKEKKMLKSETSKSETESTGKSVKEPFTILLMGIDSTDEVLTKNAVANGDSLILITFNPKTLNATMLSIPRDSYVPIACWPSKDENKITHAAAYGNDCMINTIEDFFDVNIDYYAKINFKGLVKLVDALGGIDVDVPQDLCTDNSNREVEICIHEGRQHLNGEEALVLSRNRKQLVNGDFGRGLNQQLVIQAMLEKIKSLRSVNQFTNVLNTVSNSLDTNLTTKQILSFYSIAKDIAKIGLSNHHSNIINIQQLYLEGASAMIYDKRMRMDLYNYVPNTYSKNDIIKAMKMNLGLASHKITKTFSFSINEPYEKKVIGEGPYQSTYNPSKYKKSNDYTNKKSTNSYTNQSKNNNSSTKEDSNNNTDTSNKKDPNDTPATEVPPSTNPDDNNSSNSGNNDNTGSDKNDGNTNSGNTNSGNTGTP